MSPFTEKSTVESYIIEKLKEKGWKHVPGEELGREDYSEPLLIDRFFLAVRRINSHVDLTGKDLNQLLLRLKSLPSTFEGSKQVLRFLKDGIPIELEKTGELRYLSLLDYENPENNEFVVSDQVTFHGPQERCRLDLVLYVNGLPLVAVECKNPTDPSREWEDAYRQIKSYEKMVPELFKYVQFSLAAAATTRYFPNVLGAEEVKTYGCTPEEEDERTSLDLALEFLAPAVLMDLVANFIFAREQGGEFTKVLPHPIQYEATNRIYQRVVDNLLGKENKDRGLIWHWQGSGKTLTMIFATHKLYRCRLLENPTIFLVVDREELETQLRNEFSFLDLGIPEPEVISSIGHLEQVLSHDGGRGKRGIFLTLIHKFAEDLLGLEPWKVEGISRRKNVVVLIDEGHRTQYGKLAGHMRNLLRSAFFFAFTGTPLSKKKRDTFLIFSYPELGELYLHKYFIGESIRDGFTLPIVFQTRMEKEVGLAKELLEEFLRQELEEIPEEAERAALERKISGRLNQIVVFLENPSRIEKIARDIASHFRESVEGRFKGMVVAASRKACAYYKEALDKFLGPEYSEVVMTFNPHTDPEPIRSCYERLREKYPGKEVEEIWKEIVGNFKDKEYPKLLIVTDKLLTGFDAPILQVMYLDKPLKEHRLLQAIARTNRPFKELKTAGLIIDYVGILKEFEKAVAIYEKQDLQYVGFSPQEKMAELERLLRETEELLEGVDKTRTDFQVLKEVAKLLFHDLERQRKFMEKYRKAR
ncbi:MAG: HsdR family type I site-specific deoxyribonuclease, partial [Candidatus Hadarchaeales archaeon]